MEDGFLDPAADSNSVEAELKDIVSPDLFPTAIPSVEVHDKLLKYLVARLKTDSRGLEKRRNRYERLDRDVATWQKKSKEDEARDKEAETKGTAVATSFNIPIMHTYIEDMVSFYTQVFAPQNGSFFSMPTDIVGEEEALKALVRKMNTDAKQGSYYQQLGAFARSCLVYNSGGFHNEWLVKDGQVEGKNEISNIDMYNFSFDPSSKSLSMLHKEAAWAAIFKNESVVTLYRKEQSQVYQGIERAFKSHFVDSPVDPGFALGTTGKKQYYVQPPIFTSDSDLTKKSASRLGDYLGEGEDWDGEGLPDSYDVVDMYCWINPEKHQLGGTKGFSIWRFTIVNGRHIVRAEKHDEAQFPIYATVLNKQTLHSEQKSAAEHIQPFQRLISFLANIFVKGSRKNIYGLTYYDPLMFDLKNLKEGVVSANVPSKLQGRDVRTGILHDTTQVDVREMLPAMGQIMQLMNQLFPAQSLPSQVAGIDRAVKNQVAAVMQGANRRLHMNVRDLDSGVMGPLYMNLYRNLDRYGNGDYKGVHEQDIITLIGTGLMQLNRESAEEAMRALLFALIQNPQSAQQLDIIALMNYWASLSGVDINLDSAMKNQGQPPSPVAPGGPGNTASPSGPPGVVPPAGG